MELAIFFICPIFCPKILPLFLLSFAPVISFFCQLLPILQTGYTFLFLPCSLLPSSIQFFQMIYFCLALLAICPLFCPQLVPLPYVLHSWSFALYSALNFCPCPCPHFWPRFWGQKWGQKRGQEQKFRAKKRANDQQGKRKKRHLSEKIELKKEAKYRAKIWICSQFEGEGETD